MSLPSLRGPALGSLRSSIIGSGTCLLKTIVWRSSFLAGPSIDKARAGAHRLPMNFLTLLSHGLEIQSHGSERGGRKERDSRSSSHIGEPCLFWMAWSRSKIRLVQKKDGCVSLLSKRSYANSLPSIRGFA